MLLVRCGAMVGDIILLNDKLSIQISVDLNPHHPGQSWWLPNRCMTRVAFSSFRMNYT